MITYAFVIISMFLIMILNNQLKSYGSKNVHKLSGLLFILLLGLVAGLRYNTGTDYFSYYHGYAYFKTMPISIVNEPGIIVISKLASFLYDDPATMIFISAVITVSLMVSTILKNSKLYWLSLFLYVFLGSWHGCFNGVRQYLAAAILFSGHRYIIDEKFVKWLIVVCVACLFHITAVIAILFYFYPKLKINLKNLILSLILVLVFLYLYEYIFGFIEILKNDTFDFEGVGSGYLTSSINPLRIIVAWIPTILFRCFSDYYDKNDKEVKFYSNMGLLHALLMTVAINSTYLGRVGIYTGIYIAMFWPIILQKVEIQSKKLLIVFIFFFYFIYWCTEISGPTLIDYKWIFLR